MTVESMTLRVYDENHPFRVCFHFHFNQEEST